jgi:hypothetical protein
MDEGIEKSRGGTGSVEASPLPRDDSRWAMERGGGVGRDALRPLP